MTGDPRRFAHPRTPRRRWPTGGGGLRALVRPAAAWHVAGRGRVESEHPWRSTRARACSGSPPIEGCWRARGDGATTPTNPAVLCQPYRAEEGGETLSIFFRDTALSDAIGFHYATYASAEQAASTFSPSCGRGSLTSLAPGRRPRGERDPGRGERLGSLSRGRTTVLARAVCAPGAGRGYSNRDVQRVPDRQPGPARSGAPTCRAAARLRPLHWLLDRCVGQLAPGVDLDTWIGQEPKSRGWELLGGARDALTASGATPQIRTAGLPGAVRGGGQ